MNGDWGDPTAKLQMGRLKNNQFNFNFTEISNHWLDQAIEYT